MIEIVEFTRLTLEVCDDSCGYRLWSNLRKKSFRGVWGTGDMFILMAVIDNEQGILVRAHLVTAEQRLKNKKQS